jgi:hypothetical protein
MFGQCLPRLISKIKSLDSFASADVDQDIVQLLLIVRGYCCHFDDHQWGTWALKNAKHCVSVVYQGYNMSTMENVENFKALISTVEIYCSVYGRKPRLVRAQLIKQNISLADQDAPNPPELKKAKAMCREKYLSSMLPCGAHQSRYLKLKDVWFNSMTKGVDNFPKTIFETMRLMNDKMLHSYRTGRPSLSKT